MITDDLAPLFGTSGPGVRFRQGTILSWDPNTGSNTVDVGGSALANLPILNTGEAIALKAGHIVGLLGQGRSWFIIGRVTPPNDPNFAGASLAFGGEGKSAVNFAVSAAAASKVSGSIAVPSWADEAVVLLTANASLVNSSASAFYVTMQALIDGVGGGAAQFGLGPTGGAAGSANDLNSGTCSAQRLITDPGPTISLGLNVWTSGGTIPAHGSSIANIDAIAIFRSTV